MKHLNRIKGVIEKILGTDQIHMDYPPSIKFGELAVPCFAFAKPGEAPNETANKLAQACAKDPTLRDIISQATAIGPYVNFHLTDKALLEEIEEGLDKQCWGKLLPPDKTMVEFLSPNTNKPLHLGHLRNACLGDAVSLILQVCGQTVIKANLINDRGVHICKSMLAWKKWANGATPESTRIKGDHFVGDWYIRYNQELINNPTLEDQVREMLRQWEAGDAEILQLWQTMNKWVLNGFEKTLKRLEVHFDRIYLESNTYKLGKDVVKQGLGQEIFTTLPDGSVIYHLPQEQFGLDKNLKPKFVLLRRPDGTSVYITQDIGTAIMKADDYGLDHSIYVVGSEQNYHFQCLFSILKSLGYPWADGLYHLSYGMVKLPSGKMKSREGTVVDADDLIDEMVESAKALIHEKHPDLPEPEVTQRAEIIGIGSMKFYLLLAPPANGMNYDPAASISFEGKTGPYCQYAAVRARTILEKAAEKGLEPSLAGSVNTSRLGLPERELAVKLLQLQHQIKLSAETLNPSILADHVYQIAQAFNKFYNSTPIIKDDPGNDRDQDLISNRLLLVEKTQRAIENGLALLGIQTPEKM